MNKCAALPHYTFQRTGGSPRLVFFFLSSHWLRDSSKLSTSVRCQNHPISSKTLSMGPKCERAFGFCFILAFCLLASNHYKPSCNIGEKGSCRITCTRTQYAFPSNTFPTNQKGTDTEQKTESQDGEEEDLRLSIRTVHVLCR